MQHLLQETIRVRVQRLLGRAIDRPRKSSHGRCQLWRFPFREAMIPLTVRIPTPSNLLVEEIERAGTSKDEDCTCFNCHHNDLIPNAVLRIHVHAQFGNPRSPNLLSPNAIMPRARILFCRYLRTR